MSWHFQVSAVEIKLSIDFLELKNTLVLTTGLRNPMSLGVCRVIAIKSQFLKPGTSD